MWSIAITLYDQRSSENVGVFTVCTLAAAIFIYMEPKYAISFFGINQILLILFFKTFQSEPIDNIGNYINTTITTITAILIAISRYRGYASDYHNNAIIKRQSRQIQIINKKLHNQANSDELTGLYNRRYLEEMLPELWQKYRDRDMHIGILMIDVDNFKSFNDKMGHLTGDLALKLVASQLLKNANSETDSIIRFGGEEFLVIRFGGTLEKLLVTAENIRQSVEDLEVKSPSENILGNLTVSIGTYVEKIEGEMNIYRLIDQADKALYEAKRHGKNLITIIKTESLNKK